MLTTSATEGLSNNRLASAGTLWQDGRQRRYAYLLLANHHKSGTAQALCFARVVRSIAGAPFKDMPGNSSTFDLSVTIAGMDSSRPAGSPPAILRLVNPLTQQCFWGNPDRPGAGLQCPQPEAPCDSKGRSRLSLQGCQMHLPLSPRGALGKVLFVRQPMDVVVSAYLYHMQQPAPEAWIDRPFTNASDYTLRHGVPDAALKQLGLDTAGASSAHLSYGEVLRSLPEELGVQLEFWRSAPELYTMARQYAMLAHDQDAILVRYEHMGPAFNATWRPIMDRFYPEHATNIMEAGQDCDPGTWDAARLAQSNHVTATKHPADTKQRLRAALEGRPAILRHLCRLAAALEYPIDARCAQQQF